MEQQSGITLERRVTGSSINITNINEVEQNCRDIVISIEKMRKQLSPPIDAECNIFRIPKRLLNINRKAYTPQVISIGPFHHNTRSNFMATDQHKLQALNCYLRRVNKTLEAVVEMAQKWESKARRCYSEPINMKSDEFIIMLLLDGCFIVEFMMLVHENYSETLNGLDPSFYKAISTDIYRDLTMLENQLPFFVLEDVFDLIPDDKRGDDICSFLDLTHEFLSIGLVKDYAFPNFDVCPHKAKHLVDLLSFYFVPSCDAKQNEENNLSEDTYLIPPSITELCEAGVKIKKAKEAKCVMNISFKKGVLEIPPLDIDDHFETNVRNVMAFGHYSVVGNQMFAIQHALLMDDLINTEKDVRLLVNKEIITNNIGGSDKEVARLFNDICKYVTVPDDFCYFNHISAGLRKHCDRRRHKWMATLKHNYFNTPWAIISFLAAIFLIVLSLLQTIFTAISTFKKHP